MRTSSLKQLGVDYINLQDYTFLTQKTLFEK